MTSRPSAKRPQTASLKLGLDTSIYYSPRGDTSSNNHRMTPTSTQISEQRHSTRTPSAIFLDKKVALLSVSPSPDTTKVTNLSEKSQKKMMYYLYTAPKEKVSSLNLKFDSSSTDYAFDNLSKVEKAHLQASYDEYKKNYDRMVFDEDRNFVYFKPPSKKAIENLSFSDEKKRKRIFKKIEKISSKVQDVKPEEVIDKAEDVAKLSRHKSTRNYMLELKKRRLEWLENKVKGHKIETVLQHTSHEMEAFAHRAGELLEHVENENIRLKEANERLEKQVEDLKDENVILKRTNQLLQQRMLSDTEEKQDLITKCQSLEFFQPVYEMLKTRFPNHSIKDVIAKFDKLEAQCYEHLNRISLLEEEKLVIKNEGKKLEEALKDKDVKIKSDQQERNKIVNLYRHEMADMESEIMTRRNFEKDYLALSNKVIDMFTEWSGNLKVYLDFETMPELNAKCRDPLEILEVMSRMIKITTPDSMQRYLRAIIVSANQLRRKYFPNSVNTKYDPDKIYDMCSKYIESLEKQIKRQRSTNTSYMSGNKASESA